MDKWFVTWNRPEYKEWARETPGGYILLVIDREKNKFLCVKARLLMQKTGLPKFITDQELRVSSKPEAAKRIENWRKNISVD